METGQTKLAENTDKIQLALLQNIKYMQANYHHPLVIFLVILLEELILCNALAAGAIFSSILPALLGVYFKIYPQLYWEYFFQHTPSRAGPIRENITQLIKEYWKF